MTPQNRSRWVLTAVCLLCLSRSRAAQSASKVTEPEYFGVFAAIDPSTGALIELERHTTTHRVKLRALGFGGGEAHLEIPGQESRVRFKADAVPAFVVRLTSQQSDPQGSIRLISWRVDKGVRYITVQKAGAFGAGSTAGAAESLLPFNVVKYGDTSFKIVPAEPLPPGEYALGPPGGHDSFSFGIDHAGEEKPPSHPVEEAVSPAKPLTRTDATADARGGPAVEKPLTNDDVLAMVKADLGDELTISKIKQAPAVDLDVSADALIRMKKQGASKAVIDAMMKRAAKPAAK
jgi:hypothetical protein